MFLRHKVVKEAYSDPLIDLSGSTLKVYLILLSSKRPLGVREIQRAAGFRSPNSARHHLEKLVELGYALRVEEGYVAVKPRGSILSFFIMLRGILLPKALFYALLTTLLTIAYIVLRYPGVDIYPLTFMVSISVMLWLDATNLLRKTKYLTRLGIKK